MENYLSEELLNMTGPIGISLVNDYFFNELLLQSKTVLKGLVASLLHYSMDEIKSVLITNETNRGEEITSKSFILDIKVILNDNTIINLEMQVLNKGNWPERSLSYLCRAFDNLKAGEDYRNVRPCIHIEFLDFTLFKDSPEFYSNYYLINKKNHRVFSDKFRLSVVDLTNIELATEEDKIYKIDKWASFFKSNTWEELKMLSENNEVMAEATTFARKLTADEMMKERMRYREEAIAYEQYTKNEIATLKAENEMLKAKLKKYE